MERVINHPTVSLNLDQEWGYPPSCVGGWVGTFLVSLLLLGNPLQLRAQPGKGLGVLLLDPVQEVLPYMTAEIPGGDIAGKM